MKTVHSDRGYIDFTSGNSGVRVWKDRCQAIRRDHEHADWLAREDVIPVPVPDSILGFPHSGQQPVAAVAFEVGRYDGAEADPELRAVLKGWMTFEEAIRTT